MGYNAVQTHWQSRLQNNATAFWSCIQTDSPLESESLLSAIEYSATGGKNLRALLVYAANDLYKKATRKTDDIALSIELFHTFTLIHDDLPAIDNDAMRRGKASCHIFFDEATAIIAGDTLHTLAYFLLNRASLDASFQKQAYQIFIEASLAVMSGQMFDIEGSAIKESVQQYERMCLAKTAALVRASLLLGALSSESQAARTTLASLGKIGDLLGLAFQLQDDLLDIEGTPQVLGKQTGSDLKNAKQTLASQDTRYTKQRIHDLFSEIHTTLYANNWQDSQLQALVDHISKRTK